MRDSKQRLLLTKEILQSIIICTAVGSVLLWPFTAAAFQLKGTLGTLARGYDDASATPHYDVAQSLRLNACNIAVEGLSLHTYMQYYGDEVDDFSASGTARLYHGYLQYQRMSAPFRARAGRFFLFHGVAVGVLDGVEASYSIRPGWSATAFGGAQGPLSREWESETPSDSPWIGAEVRGNLRRIWGVKPTFSFSYTRQEREGNLLRHLIGLSAGLKINRRWTSLNIVHLDLGRSALRKALTRWRYMTPKFQFRAEAGIFEPYINPYSYFSSFNIEQTTWRLRNTIEYHLVPRKWGLGLSTQYFGTSKTGFQSGPYIIFPYGRIGYHFTSGDQPTNNVLWGYFNAIPLTYLELYGYAADMDYEWEEMAIESQKTTTLNAGLRLRPPFLKRTEFGLEWQNYQTPQLSAYRRVIFRFTWNFDYRVKE